MVPDPKKLALGVLAAASLWATARPVLSDSFALTPFSHPLAGITSSELALFNYGRGFFHHDFAPITHPDGRRSGLGDHFNATSCSSCHIGDGRGAAHITGSADGTTGVVVLLRGASAAHGLGGQVRDRAGEGQTPPALINVTYEEVHVSLPGSPEISLRRPRYVVRLPDGRLLDEDAGFSPRLAPPVFGLGLLAAVPDSALLALADADDLNADGISGRVGVSISGETGRFGWKADVASILEQSTKAAQADMGLTVGAGPGDIRPDLDAEQMRVLVNYLKLLSPPPVQDHAPAQIAGAEHFESVGCAACHVRALPLDPVAAPAPGLTEVRAYTDLLLHDMGPDLADRAGENAAEWRTAPLWGLGFAPDVLDAPRYLHDGRARSLMEAILWHGGEASDARDGFMALDAKARDALLAFVQAL